MKRVLVIRFSSIGDIVLCSPVLRNLKNQFPEIQIDVLTKKEFAFVWDGNPHIHRVLNWGVPEDMSVWRNAPYDAILDLHNNLRSNKVKLRRWDCLSITLDKQNIAKWLLVVFKKTIIKIKPIHVRYAKMLEVLGIKEDGLGLEYYGVQDFLEDKLTQSEFVGLPKSYFAIALGGSFVTKQIPLKTYLRFFEKVQPGEVFVLLGGNGDKKTAEALTNKFPDNCINLCGKLTLGQSAGVLNNADVLISGDTGLAHIGAALGKSILWVWGSTSPELGMLSPVKPTGGAIISMEVEGLKCRPCSKLGHADCPKGHFKCMDHNPVLWRENLEKLTASALG